MDDSDQKSDVGIQSSDEVQEGEVVSSDVQTTEGVSDSSATVLESLELMIREHLAKISRLTVELNQQKEMLESVLENDETYKQHAEAAKVAQKTKSATKYEILKRPDVTHVNVKVKELVTEIKESKESLNSYLPEYQRLSGSNEINDQNGEPMQIVYQARLVKRQT